MRRKRSKSLVPPHGVRALVPVFGVQGGAGRSTLTGLLAQAFAPSTRTVVLDTAPRSASPWPDWVGVGTKVGEKAGFPGLASNPGTPDRAELLEAKARREVTVRRGEAMVDLEPGEQPGYDVLADLRPWTRPPVDVPEDPRWYARIVETGGWFTGVVDTTFPAAAVHLQARTASRQSMLDHWFQRRDAVPVLVATSSAAGPARLHRLANLLDTDGLPTKRAVVAIVDVTGGDRPKWLPGALESLAERVGLLVQVPFDKAIHNDELTYPDAVAASTLSAVREIAQQVASSVQHEPGAGTEPEIDMAAYRAQVEAEHGPLPVHEPYEPPTPPPSPAPSTPTTPPVPPGQKSGGWVPGRGR